MKLTAEDQMAVLIRARALLARRCGWKNGSRYYNRTQREMQLSLGEACHLAAFELDLVPTKRNGGYTVALATGLLKHLGAWGHKSLAGFNDDPQTRKTHVLALLDRRIVELM